MKAKYVELVPRKHTRLFEDKHDAWKYWQKRHSKFTQNWKLGEDFKSYFNAKVLPLNKNGSIRKSYVTKPLTKKSREAQKKGHQRWLKKLKIENENKMKLRKGVEKELEDYLYEKGFFGKVNIKFFKKLK